MPRLGPPDYRGAVNEGEDAAMTRFFRPNAHFDHDRLRTVCGTFGLATLLTLAAATTFWPLH
jgi:hypothetical protein